MKRWQFCRVDQAINTLIYFKQNNNKYYTWAGALKKTGSNLHTLETGSGSIMRKNLTSSTSPNIPPKKSLLFWLPHVIPNPSKSKKVSSLISTVPKILKTTALKILTCRTCFPMQLLKDKSSMKKSISKNLLLFLKNMIVWLLPSRMNHIMKPVISNQRNCLKLLSKRDKNSFTKKEKRDQNKRVCECFLKRLTKLSLKWMVQHTNKWQTSL